jgi:hypothetical protein
MTATDTIQWMKDEGICKRCLLPVNGLSTDDPDLKAYVGCSVGKSLEMMPLDCSLNQDIHVAVDQHVIHPASLIAVEGLGNRTGKRYLQSGTEQRGGTRPKLPAVIIKQSTGQKKLI